MTLQGKMNVGACELMNEVRELSPSARARAYEGMATFVEGVMEHLGISSSVLHEYVSSLKRDAGYEASKSKETVGSKYR